MNYNNIKRQYSISIYVINYKIKYTFTIRNGHDN